jgi:hypothetical protein
MKKLHILILLLSTINIGKSQTVDLWKVNVFTPSLEYEKSIAPQWTLAQKAGITFSGSLPPLTEFYILGESFLYQIAPFYDIQSRWFYNFDKRQSKSKNIENNVGNFITFRAQYVGPEIASSFTRYSPHTFKIGPYWGIQRNNGSLNYYFNIGPAFIFDDVGNSAIWPIEVEFRLGWLLKRKLRSSNN